MYPDWQGNLILVVGLVITIWLAGLSLVVWKIRNFLNKLFPSHQGDLKTKLEAMIDEVRGLDGFKKHSLSFVQNIALKRYNPYQDTGGDQSFSVALLDGKGDGVVITSLHSRAGTRVFAKPVLTGKETQSAFSEEEKKVVEEARN